MQRRIFLKRASLLGSAALTTPQWHWLRSGNQQLSIRGVNSNFEREPLVRPFGFKGGYMSEIWQTIARFDSPRHMGLGLCTQNVLWSDAQVFSSHSEAAGNAIMYAITERALQMLDGQSFLDPIACQEDMLDELYGYASTITERPDLRMTFVLNALVGVDNALWLLYAREHGITDFDRLIPDQYTPALSYQHDKVASIPLMAYTIPISEIEEAADQGYFFMKIKIGQPGTQQEMLEKDKQRLTDIHRVLGDRETPHTANGKLPYYFDANGRYEHKETLLRLLDHAKKIGAYDQIAVIEEPFPEHAEIDVHDIEVRLAADESAHTDRDAATRIEMGYRAIALKAIAKTLSMTMKIAQTAHEAGVPCFCADLTVNPILVEWNKAVAARLAPFPGLENMGLLETNGHQNYLHWEKMRRYHPYPHASWSQPKDGLFQLNSDYYEKSGGIFSISDHYLKKVSAPEH